MEIALMKEFKFNQNYIVPNVHFGVYMLGKEMHECDLLVVTKSGYATEIEIKVSKADLKKDFTKKHSHDHPAIGRLFYAVPEELKEIALELIPDNAGLITVDDEYYCSYVKDAVYKEKRHKWNKDEIFNVLRLGTMRIFNLKKRINN